MGIALVLLLNALLFYALLRASSGQRDWNREDEEQAEYLREYNRRRQERKKKRTGT